MLGARYEITTDVSLLTKITLISLKLTIARDLVKQITFIANDDGVRVPVFKRI